MFIFIYIYKKHRDTQIAGASEGASSSVTRFRVTCRDVFGVPNCLLVFALVTRLPPGTKARHEPAVNLPCLRSGVRLTACLCGTDLQPERERKNRRVPLARLRSIRHELTAKRGPNTSRRDRSGYSQIRSRTFMMSTVYQDKKIYVVKKKKKWTHV